MTATGPLDDIDAEIVAHLVGDGRATLAEIGQTVRLSVPAVKRRIDRLREAGVIRGFTAIVEPASVGWTTEAFVHIFCRGTVAPASLQRAWEHIPEVVSAMTVTGPSDAILRVVARDVQHLESALERIRQGENIDHSETVIVLSRLIDRGRS